MVEHQTASRSGFLTALSIMLYLPSRDTAIPSPTYVTISSSWLIERGKP